MVIPWVGYSLSGLVRRVEPLGNAKFVEFITQADPKTMPGVVAIYTGQDFAAPYGTPVRAIGDGENVISREGRRGWALAVRFG